MKKFYILFFLLSTLTVVIAQTTSDTIVKKLQPQVNAEIDNISKSSDKDIVQITNDYVNIFGIIISILGTGLTVYQLKEANTQKKERISVNWVLLQSLVKDLALKIRKDFEPDVIITPGVRGATIVNLLSYYFKTETIIIVGTTYNKEAVNENMIKNRLNEDHFFIETTKWIVFFPLILLGEKYKGQKILIADDMVTSGDFMAKCKEKLCCEGCNSSNIKTMSVVVTSTAKISKKEPDYSIYQVEGSDFYFPWGKGK